jgi:hypothetical protein
MDVPDRPLAASQEFLRVLAACGREMRPRMLSILQARDEPHHRQAAAASLFRLPNLCEAVVLLNDAELFDEAATLVRVIAELAICAAWVGKNDARAWDLARDTGEAANRGDAMRLEHLGLKPWREPLPDPKRLPPLRNRAEEAGSEVMGLFAGVYDILSGPSHSALTPLGHLDPQSRSLYGRGTAGFAVQAAYRLWFYPCGALEITEGRETIGAARAKWTASRG